MISYMGIPYVVYVPFCRGSFLRKVSVRYVGGIAGIRSAKKPALADICNWIMWQSAVDPTPSAAMICKVSNNS